MLRQQPFNVRWIDRLAPLDGVTNQLDAVAAANVGPATGEQSGVQYDGLAAPWNEIDDGGFHGAGTRAGEHDDVVFRAKDVFESGQHVGKQRAKLRCPVVDHLASHGQAGLLGHLRRAGSDEALLGHTLHELGLLSVPGEKSPL